MSKPKLASFLLGLLGLVIIVGASYVATVYSTAILNSIADFLSSNNVNALKNCGITPPTQFNEIKADMTRTLLPALYIGLPLVMLLVAAFMFLAGYYYHKARLHDDTLKKDNMRKELEQEIVKKVAAQVAMEKKEEVRPPEPVSEDHAARRRKR